MTLGYLTYEKLFILLRATIAIKRTLEPHLHLVYKSMFNKKIDLLDFGPQIYLFSSQIKLVRVS